MDRLGPSYVKLGQFLATRPDIVCADVARELERLQDRVAPMPREAAVRRIEAAFQAGLETVFSEFGEPVAAASIAQVHKARVGDGERVVAVKVLRPGVERRFARDLADMQFAARLAERMSPETRRLQAGAGGRDAGALGADGDGLSPGGGGRGRISAKTSRTRPTFARPRSTGTAPRAKC